MRFLNDSRLGPLEQPSTINDNRINHMSQPLPSTMLRQKWSLLDHIWGWSELNNHDSCPTNDGDMMVHHKDSSGQWVLVRLHLMEAICCLIGLRTYHDHLEWGQLFLANKWSYFRPELWSTTSQTLRIEQRNDLFFSSGKGNIKKCNANGQWWKLIVTIASWWASTDWWFNA